MIKREKDEGLYEWQNRLFKYQIKESKQAMIADIGMLVCGAVFIFLLLIFPMLG